MLSPMFSLLNYASTELVSPLSLPSTVDQALANHSIESLLHTDASNVAISAADIPTVRRAVWEKYRTEQRQNPLRQAEHADHVMRHNGASMRYTAESRGSKPSTGWPLYIALHGGGSAPPSLNDSQWRDMQTYYRDSVHTGLYVAPRGISDTWDLHFRPESYVFYDRLIENMILFEDVDPDRVYVLGYSAGGDGVYQIASRMSDRWAAADMSAGHPNGVDVRSLRTTPFLLQVGENDAAYNRNRVTAEYDGRFNTLRQQTGDYPHAAWVHANKPHNFYDNDPAERPQRVLADPQAWLSRGDRRTVDRNTNAIRWLSQYSRQSQPENITWSLTNRADRHAATYWMAPTHGEQLYWLDVGAHTADSLGTEVVEARIDKAHNSVHVTGARTYLKIWLSEALLDLQRPVRVHVGGQTLDVHAQPNLRQVVQSLANRGDPRLTYGASVVLNQVGDTWVVGK